MVSRRQWLSSIHKRGEIAFALLLLAGCARVPFDEDSPRNPWVVECTLGTLEPLKLDFGIEIVTTAPPAPEEDWSEGISWTVAPQDELDSFSRVLAEELRIYPRLLLERSRLRRIVLCRDLKTAGRPLAGLNFRLTEGNVILINIVNCSEKPFASRLTLHHEFLHALDGAIPSAEGADREWIALNQKQFSYGHAGGGAHRDRWETQLTAVYPGYLNRYGMRALGEDKAVLFAQLILDPLYVKARAQKDSILASKVDLLKAELLYFCPGMSGYFWEINGERRTGAYLGSLDHYHPERDRAREAVAGNVEKRARAMYEGAEDTVVDPPQEFYKF